MAQKRSIQNAADASALAAAQELPGTGPCDATCRVAVVAKIQQYSTDNGGPAVLDGGSFPGDPSRCLVASDTDCYTNPYKGNDQIIQVRLKKAVTTFFTGTVGLGSLFDVGATAAASATQLLTGTPGTTSTSVSIHNGTTIVQTIDPSTSTSFSTTTTPGGNIALFAKNTTCSSNGSTGIFLGATGNSLHVNGLSISNGSVWIDGNPQTSLTAVNYKGPNNCSIGGSQGASAVGTIQTHDNDMDWPQTWDKNTICNSGGPNVHYFKNDLTTDNHIINASGIWCADNGQLTLNGNNATMQVTVIGPRLSISAQHLTLTPYPAANDPLTNNLLFYQTQGDFSFAPNNSNITGWMWVPLGRLTYGGNSASQGFYEAKDISITGNSFDIIGNGPLGTPQTSTSSTTTTIPGTTSTVLQDPGSTVTTVTSIPGTTSTVGTTIGLDE